MKTNPTGTYLMRPPHQRSTEFLSRRYDLSSYEYENITWDFYESMHKSAPTILAREAGENSIETFRLDKYIKLSQAPPAKPPKTQYPPPFNKLIPLQEKSGKWTNPDQVRKVLDIPNDLTLTNTTPWEEATALALAAMRIRCDLFDLLHEHHDKAIGLITDKALLYRAAHIVGAKEFDRRDQAVHDLGASNRQREEEEERNRTAIIPSYTVAGGAGGRNLVGHNFDSAGGVRESQLTADDSLAHCESVSQATSITKYTYVESEPYDFSKPKGRNSTLSHSAYTPLKPLPTFVPPPVAATAADIPTPMDKSPRGTPGSAKGKGRYQERERSPRKGKDRDRNQQPVRTPTSTLSRNVSFGTSNELSKSVAAVAAAAIATTIVPPTGSTAMATAATATAAASEGGMTTRLGSALEGDGEGGADASVVVSNSSSGSMSGSRVASPELAEGGGTFTGTGASTAAAAVSRSPSPSKLAAMMARAQAGAKDPRRIAAVTREIDSEKMSIIEAVTAVDRHVEELKRCLQECAAGYSDSTLYAVRNVQFSRLTAMLGDGFEARPGLDDWRSVGVSGFRPLVVRCLGHVYRLAQARLLLEELQDPGRANPRGEDYVDLTNYVVSIDTVRTSKTPQRWSFLWDGEEVVSKILHSLDFLRTSAELSEWYGRSFFFTANPLMLPFPMDLINCVEPLDMTARIQQELTSRPWQLTAPRDLAHDWQYQAYLVHWCNSFNEICSERHSFNWPNLPNIKEDYDRNALYTAMLMLQCKCFVDIEESAERERKFITLSGTQRGAHLLVWETHNPPPKPRRYLLPENRKHVRVEDAVTKALEKRAAKLLLEHNATLGIFPDDPSLSSGSGSGSCVEQDAARDRQVGLAEYNNMVAEMMAANPIPAGVGTDTGTGKKIPLHKLKNSLNSNPVRSVRSSRLVIGTSADVAANKKALNVSNPDAIRQHTYKTLGNTGTDTDTGAGAGVGLQPQTAATRTAIVVPNRDDAVPGAVRLQQSSIRLAAGATLPVIGSKAKPAAGIGIGMGMPPASGSGSGSRARLRGDTMHAARSAGTAACAGVGVRDSIRVSASAPGLNQQQTQAHGQAQGQAQPQGLATMPSAAAAASEKRKSKFGKKLSILISSNLSSTAAGGSGGVDSPTAVRSAVTRVPRASIMTTSSGGGGSGSGTGRLTRRVTGRGSGTGPTSATFNAKSK